VATSFADATAGRVVARRVGRSLIAPAAFAVCFVAQCLWFIGTQSLTYDEPVHVIAGLDAWRAHRFAEWNDQPPLGRLLVTAPLLLSPPDRWRIEDLGPSGANYWTVSVRPDPASLAWRTRLVTVALGLLLAPLLWFTARRLFSEGAANLALVLFAFSPALIAHFSLATVDGLATLMCFASAVAVVRWRTAPSWPRTLVVGLALGGFLASKFSAPPLVLLALGVMTIGGRGKPTVRIAKALTALVVATIAVWGTYGWHVGPVTFRNGSLSGPYARGNVVILPVNRHVNRTVSLPAPEFVAALDGVTQHGVRGQPTFFMGETKRSGGWHRFFPVLVLLKWPLAVWLLAGAALILGVAGRLAVRSEFALLMLWPLTFFSLAITTNLDVGDRYVLPVYPFLLLACAAVWDVARTRSAARLLVVALVAWQAVDVFRYAPDYLSYFNVFVQPETAYTRVTDSSLDWGQGLVALRAYQRAHANAAISLAYFGGVDPASYGIRARSLGEHDRVHGTVVVSATHLSGQYLQDPTAYRWLLEYPRTIILNHTLHVFEVP
jgi:4-amino-4-deoxy-L-arabinose transferase-like glycosyltransferase